MTQSVARLGVVIVSFQSGAFIDECLESVFGSQGVDLRVVVVDNASTDNTCQVIADWASGDAPFAARKGSPLPAAPSVAKPIGFSDTNSPATSGDMAPLTLLRQGYNEGYAAAVNAGLKLLLADSQIDLLWVLNPDCVVPHGTAARIVAAADGQRFSLMGGRVIYYERPHEVQTDGGKVSRLTGSCTSMNTGCDPAKTPLPDVSRVDYITGASLVASRAFIDDVGVMTEDYFLYYEEVDWAFRRGDLPLLIVPEMVTFHRGGTTIGTGDTTRLASPFANYFNYRNRMIFVRRFRPIALPFALMWAAAKFVQIALKGALPEARAILIGALDLSPPAVVQQRFSDPRTRKLAFGRRHGG